MTGIHITESYMDLLLSHGRISIGSGLSIGRHGRCSQHGKEKYVCFYLFHMIFQLCIMNYELCIVITILDSVYIPHKDKYPCQEVGTSSA